MSELLRKAAREAVEQKTKALEKGNGGYSPIPHYLYHKVFPDLKAKYDAKTARECLALFYFLHAHTNGQSEKEYYMWAFPSVATISEGTGIHKDRMKFVSDVLEAEGLLKTTRIPWGGHTKKMFLPLYDWDGPGIAPIEKPAKKVRKKVAEEAEQALDDFEF